MSLADTPQSPEPDARSPGGILIEALILVMRAFMGSLLGISTAAVFGVFALVAFAGLTLDLAIVSVAIAMNAMLLSLVTLGNLGGRDEV